MPELPEVEIVRRGVESRLLGRLIESARLHRRDMLVAPGDPAGGFSRQRDTHRPVRVSESDLLIGATVLGVQRRGKQIAICARSPDGSERALGVQLGMTGHLGFEGFDAAHMHAEWIVAPEPKTRAIRSRLVFSDARRFGGLRVFRSLYELHQHWCALGPDALSITGQQLRDALRGSRRAIKAALLDQAVLAGVGNIYADEALFEARIPPRVLAKRLDANACDRLAIALRRILADACTRGGSTLRNFAAADGTPGSYQNHHQVYGRGGLPCPACGTPLRSALIAQRTTTWCGKCQGSPRGTRAPLLSKPKQRI